MNPPPPSPVLYGRVTPNAMEVATAASIALPPRRNISAPASDANRLSLATIPNRLVTTHEPSGFGARVAQPPAITRKTQQTIDDRIGKPNITNHSATRDVRHPTRCRHDTIRRDQQ
jgi:hypothetical protein